MELRSYAVLLAFFMVGAITRCSESHLLHRRAADDDVIYDDTQADEANDDYAQNDTGDEPKEQEVPAVIVTRPETYEVHAGKDIRLSCKVEPDTGTVVQWFKDGELYFLGSIKMHPEETRFSLVPGSKDLLIKSVVREDSGVYRCEVVKSTSASINHTVIIMEPPKIIKLTATNGGSVTEGNDLLLTCEVEGVPPPQIVWSKQEKNGNQRLQEKDGEFKGNTVFMRNVERHQTGKYYCYAFNRAGHNESEIQITVAGKPRVHVPKTIVNSAVNVQAVLQCTAHEEPNPHMRWYKDGRLIEDSLSQYKVTTNGVHSNLTVTPISDEDFGTFTCEAENKHGKHNKSIELTQSPIVENLQADGPKLSWTVDSHLPLEEMEVQIRLLQMDAQWKKLIVRLPEKTSHFYEITYELQNEHLEPGKYEAYVKVKNTNSWGGNNDPVNVEIEQQPLLIQTASVLGRGNNAHSIKPSATILAAFLMYLLVRMF